MTYRSALAPHAWLALGPAMAVVATHGRADLPEHLLAPLEAAGLVARSRFGGVRLTDTGGAWWDAKRPRQRAWLYDVGVPMVLGQKPKDVEPGLLWVVR